MTDHSAFKRFLRFSVFDSSAYDVPSKLEEFIKWAQGKLELIPEEGRAGACLDFYTEGDSPKIKIDYSRLETKAEFDDRRAAEKTQEEVQREKEIKLLLALKEKYPGV